MNFNWKHIGTVIDGQIFEINGFNIWDYKWGGTGEKVIVNDPIYGQPHTMRVYEIETGTGKIKFAAGEFSNTVWGIYQEQ